MTSPPVKCPQESLSLMQEQEYGPVPATPGQKLKDGRYEIVREIRRESHSSTWLASHLEGDHTTYIAIKVLTARATGLYLGGLLHDLEFLQAIATLDPHQAQSLPHLRDHFLTASPHGEHLCLVLDLLGTDVHTFRLFAPSHTVKLPIVQKIAADVVDALASLHSLNIVNADVKPDNILFASGLDEKQLSATRRPVVEGDVTLAGASSPIPHSQHERGWNNDETTAVLYRFCLDGMENARWADKPPPTEVLTPLALRAPEVILGTDFDAKVDIWALGCSVFELLTGQPLFHPLGGETWNIIDDHLAQMQGVTGEDFSSGFLSRADKRHEFFDTSGKLHRRQNLHHVPIEQALSGYNNDVLEPDDIEPAAAFIRACIRLDPKERLSAAELQRHHWIVAQGGVGIARK